MRALGEATVSVVIAAYHAERFIAETLRSVYAQTQPIHEVIVVEDGSRDGTQEILRRHFPQVSYVWQQNAGPPAAYNTGIGLATGEFIACLDHDDVWLAEKTARQIAVFERHPGVSVVLCEPVRRKDEVKRQGAPAVGRGLRAVTFHEWFSPTAPKGLCRSMSSWVLRRAFFLSALGGFDVAARSFMDYEALLRITGLGYSVVVLRERLYHHPLLENSYGHSLAGQRVEMRELPAVLRRYDPDGEGWAAALLSREEYAAALRHVLLRCVGMALRCGEEAYARELIAWAARLPCAHHRRDLELALAARWSSLYLAVRRMTQRRSHQ